MDFKVLGREGKKRRIRDMRKKKKYTLCCRWSSLVPQFFDNDVRPSTVRDRLGRDQVEQIQAKRCMMGTEQ